MNKPLLSLLLSSGVLSACAGSGMIPRDANQFTVASSPSGATVHVMGKELGVTPLEVTKEQVFPLTYPKELENKFGRIELSYPGCAPYESPVSGYILSSGLKAKLVCHAEAKTTAGENPQERLRQLKAIFEEGLISKEEYQAKRQRILEDL